MYHNPVVGKDGSVYALGIVPKGEDTNRVYALNPNGTIKWTRDTMPIFYSTALAYSDKGIVYLSESYSGLMTREVIRGTFIVAVSEKDGKELWRHMVDDGLSQYWIPAIITDKKGRVYIGSYNRLSVFEPDGTKLWSYKINRGGMVPGQDVVTPALSNDEKTVYFMRRSGPLYALNAKTGKIKWMFKGTFNSDFTTIVVAPNDDIFVANAIDNNLYALGKDGKLKWKTQIIIEEDGELPARLTEATPAIGPNNTVLIATMVTTKRIGRLVALDRDSGEIKWSYRMGERIFNNSAPVVDSRGVIYLAYGNGKIFMFSSEGEKIKEVLIGVEAVDLKLNKKAVVKGGAQIFYTGLALVKEGIYVLFGDATKETASLYLVGEK